MTPMEAMMHWSLEIKKNIKGLLLIGHFRHNAETYEFQGPVQVVDIWKQKTGKLQTTHIYNLHLMYFGTLKTTSHLSNNVLILSSYSNLVDPPSLQEPKPFILSVMSYNTSSDYPAL